MHDVISQVAMNYALTSSSATAVIYLFYLVVVLCSLGHALLVTLGLLGIRGCCWYRRALLQCGFGLLESAKYCNYCNEK
jgi:hypothetical protein